MAPATTENQIVRKIMSGAIRKSADESAPHEAVASDMTVDRYRDTINPLGWDLSNYRGIMFFNHASHGLPVAKASKTWVDGSEAKSAKLMTRFGPVPDEVNPLAKNIEAGINFGVFDSLSVGFLPKKSVDANDRSDPGSWWPAKDYVEQELLEISIVGIPANPSALISAKQAGMDLDWMRALALRTLEEIDGEEGIWTPKSKLQIFRAVSPARVFVPNTEAIKVEGDPAATVKEWLKGTAQEIAAEENLRTRGRLS